LEFVIDSILLVHVSSGIIALLSALVAASNRKGSKNHRKVGQVFFWSMVVIGATAIPVTFFRPNPFLFFIALFSFYMAFAGYRRGRTSFKGTKLDLVVSTSALAAFVVMVGIGINMVIGANQLGWALGTFGLLGVTFASVDLWYYSHEMDHLKKVEIHLSRMLGGTIATITAVLVQQVGPMVQDPALQVALWLSPTFVITPFIAFWAFRIQKTKKFKLF
jgi:hypothetical protein